MAIQPKIIAKCYVKIVIGLKVMYECFLSYDQDTSPHSLSHRNVQEIIPFKENHLLWEHHPDLMIFLMVGATGIEPVTPTV